LNTVTNAKGNIVNTSFFFDDPAEMKAMVDTGKGAAQDFIAKLDPQDVTWIV
jgi:hypothetical protein